MTDVSTEPVLKSSSEKISLYNVVVEESNSRDGPRGVGGGGSYLGQVLLGMCR